MARGEGTTTQQMEKAPKGAVFVWCNGKTDYPRLLARKIGREDLQIQPPAWLEDAYCWRGLELPGVVVDHAARLTDRQWDGFQEALTRVRSNVELTGATDRARPVERRVGRQPDEDSQKRGPFDDIFAGCRLTQEQFDEHERVCEERARKEREDASNAPR